MIDLSKVWPEWTAEEKLGEGAYGSVYKCVRRERGITSYCAIKLITVPNDSSELDSLKIEGYTNEDTREYFNDIVDSFANEIQVMENLKGFQNIVSVEDYKIVEHTEGIGWDIYIRMELLTSFRQYLENHAMTQDEVLKLGTDICSALEICESNGVIHRDIKTDNIFIDKNGNFKLGDFGVARQLERTRSTMSRKGTYSYMAPEVVINGKYDNRADIYSLGMVMYKLLNKNRDPFLDTEKQMIRYQERADAVNRRLAGEELPKPVNASEKTAEILLKACSFNPDERFVTASEMKRELVALQGNESKPLYAAEVSAAEKTAEVTVDNESIAEPQKNVSRNSLAKFRKILIATAAVICVVLCVAAAFKLKKSDVEQDTYAENAASTLSAISDVLETTVTQAEKESRLNPTDFTDDAETTVVAETTETTKTAVPSLNFIKSHFTSIDLYTDGFSIKIVEFGSYPQSRVTDKKLIDELGKQKLNWKSYGYYSGEGLMSFGTMEQSDYMEYADVEYNGSKYRAVWIKDYRPVTTTGEHSVLSDQFINKYSKDTVFWFLYEPLKWYVVDEEKGYLMSCYIIDAQPFNNKIYLSAFGENSIYYSNIEKTNEVTDYETSSVRKWLNADFYNTAFSEEDKIQIDRFLIKNEWYDTENSTFVKKDSTSDKIFLPTYKTIKSKVNKNLLQCKGTEYAKSQSLNIKKDTTYGPWISRTGCGQSGTFYVTADGELADDRLTYYVSGIRPALYVVNP